MKNKLLRRYFVLLGAIALGGGGLQAQGVIFPQERQAGVASLAQGEGSYTLANDLFSATFVEADGKLRFDGSDGLFLLGGDELFSITLGNGTVVQASEMTLSSVRMESLAGDAKAVRASERLNGQMLVAEFTHGDLAVVWKAILRDGSHYLRTSLDLTANDNDVAMKNIRPMIYTVDNVAAGSAPEVVGNTRGAVLASNKIFAGLETPMGKNVAASTSDVSDFVYNAWTTASWTWVPGEETPQGVLDLTYVGDRVNSNNKDIIGYRGAVAFKEAGEQTITLKYKSGNHKLNVIGVDLVKDGAVVTSDYHYGTTGGSHSNNVYTIDVPEKGAYLVRISVDQTESIASEGSILYSGKVKPAEVVFGADPNKGQAAAPAARVLAAGTEINDGTSLSDTWVAADWQAVAAENVPAGVTALEIPNTSVRSLNNSVSIKTAGRITVGLQYQSGSRGIYTAGVDVVDASGNVVAGEYRKDNSNGSKNVVTYSFIVPQAGNYTLRYLEDVSFEATDCSGKLTLSYAAVDVASLDAGVDATDNWTQAEWTEVSNAPAALTGLGYNASQLRNITSVLNISSSGTLTVDYHYDGGSMKLCMAGVDVLDCTGRVVAFDYHNGAAGSSHVDNVYTLEVPAAGSYLLRYWCQTKDEGLSNSNGTITIALTARTGIRLVEDETFADAWDPDKWEVADESEIPARVNEVGAYYPDVKVIKQELVVPVDGGTLSAEFLYSSGNHRLDIVGVDVLDANGDVIASDYHFGFTGGEKSDNVYTMTIPYAGTFTLRYLCTTKTNETNQTGTINLKYGVEYTLYLEPAATTPIYGDWSRNTTLQAGKTWNVSAVVGLMAEGQARRSFLAYSERERAVPWRAFPSYNSWYELNINRNNSEDYSKNMTVAQCEEVVRQWKTNLFDKHNTRIESFLWDDGWDSYGTWTFNKNFPNGFSEPDAVVKEMGSSIGAWLGPVGGYGESGNYRRSFWSDKGGMQLSNPAYYDVFLTACTNMINDYSFNFFKFDGISGQFSSVGPDAGTTGEENAEAIINIEREIRKIKPDVFLNTTVGTWASPFWFQFSDCIWRQENDYDVIGDNTIKRENWITYRDRLVYQNYVQNSPLCPINSMMTHGFMLTNYGPPANPYNDSYEAILRELRCAFACGTNMVELYSDFALLNSINIGALGADIAECIRGQEKNADVLPDIHWVGGNPWTGGRAEVYGWASWNGKKATLALRNGANEAQNYTITLRKA